MITINEPRIIANEQKIVVSEIRLLWLNSQSSKIAHVKFDILNENDVVIDTKYIEYSGQEYNQFWTDFNSGKYVYEQYLEKENLEINLDDTIENGFLNEEQNE